MNRVVMASLCTLWRVYSWLAVKDRSLISFLTPATRQYHYHLKSQSSHLHLVKGNHHREDEEGREPTQNKQMNKARQNRIKLVDVV